MDLISKKCTPCEGNIQPLSVGEVTQNLRLLKDWQYTDNNTIKKSFKFVSFMHTMSFVNKVAEIAEAEGHHPDLYISYGSCQIEIWTHAIKGLSENDFILASKIDAL